MSDPVPRVEIDSRPALARWFASHHGETRSIWLVTWKAHVPDRYVPYRAIVEEAIAWGWIDSLPRSLDADRTMRRLSPRRPGSSWSRVNKATAERLMREGRMHAPGLAVVDRAKRDGSWAALDAVEDGVLPEDLAAALDTRPAARANFEAFPRSVRRAILEWIGSAKGNDTRERRIAETADKALRNLRANQFRQPKRAADPTGGEPPRDA